MTSRITERPISFNAQMARAILDGGKSQTRRIALAASECPFAASGDHLRVREPWALKDGQIVCAADFTDRSGYQWRASYLMQRDGSRISLEIVSVGAEHLRKISPDHAIAEGCPENAISDPISWFSDLWEKICSDPQEKFAANPLVWAIKFRVLTPR